MKEVKDQMYPLILSSVFHYEFVFIHPFTDGNDRMARLWHTAILAKWNPIFESGTPHSHYFSDELGVPLFLQICAIKCRSCALILEKKKDVKCPVKNQ